MNLMINNDLLINLNPSAKLPGNKERVRSKRKVRGKARWISLLDKSKRCNCVVERKRKITEYFIKNSLKWLFVAFENPIKHCLHSTCCSLSIIWNVLILVENCRDLFFFVLHRERSSILSHSFAPLFLPPWSFPFCSIRIRKRLASLTWMQGELINTKMLWT